MLSDEKNGVHINTRTHTHAYAYVHIDTKKKKNTHKLIDYFHRVHVYIIIMRVVRGLVYHYNTEYI